ncbi:capsular biosynthesis protein [Vibrio sp. 10N.286.49.B3]|uniref:potassium channel family protein n=1 Tax=Vibrio sp. 10N.286.49.B3 TaxID=1880855 RepID=UPI000C82F253|nr:potassium channel family protein [Vibrio sp. 10N.286.49.B3]PMH39818.1 capsular biosynthesis protein [Vibrio sp. 10N.286.49.B3]
MNLRDDTKDDTKPMSLLSLILSFLALFVISGLLFFDLQPETRNVLLVIDFIICCIFLLQLTIDFFRATDRKAFLARHWIDLIASLPLVEPLRYARLFQILRVIRVLRSSSLLIKQLRYNRRETTVASILLLLVFLLTIGSAMILHVEESNPEANIQTGMDALWWSFVTISTVGYGDHYPVSTLGKLVASGIIICGVGMFGMISGLITSLITVPHKSTAEIEVEHNTDLLEQILSQQQSIIERLDRLEQPRNQTASITNEQPVTKGNPDSN